MSIELQITDLESKTKIVLIRKPIKPKSDDWQETAFQWLVTLPTGDTIDYYTGLAHCTFSRGTTWVKESEWNHMKSKTLTQNGLDSFLACAKPTPPKFKDVLYALLTDSSAYDTNFISWCDELGYDNDSLKARNIYDACCVNGQKLNKLKLNKTELQEFFQDY